MKPKEIIKRLEKEGWKFKDSNGSHRHYIHPTTKGKVTVPYHNKDLKKGTLNSIYKQAGWK